MNSNCFLIASIVILSACQPAPRPTESVSMDLEAERISIDSLLNQWHHAAATADEETFFGIMSEDAIYLGTDRTERWRRDELKEWSRSFFERDTAWAFTPYDRQVYFSEDGHTAWFEELLDTWMGPCRGSGVLMHRDSIWTLEHYNLAMLIDNDDVNAVIALIQLRDAQPDSLLNSQ